MSKLSLVEWKVLRWMAEAPNSHVFRPDGHSTSLSGTQRDVTVGGKRAAATLAKNHPEWFEVNANYGFYKISSEGIRVAASEPRPDFVRPRPPKLTDRDWEVLRDLEAANRMHSRHGSQYAWATPLDCGGQTGSHHSASLIKLVHNGYAECKQRGGTKIYQKEAIVPEPRLFHAGKGSRSFMITEAGRETLTMRKKQTNGKTSVMENSIHIPNYIDATASGRWPVSTQRGDIMIVEIDNCAPYDLTDVASIMVERAVAAARLDYAAQVETVIMVEHRASEAPNYAEIDVRHFEPDLADPRDDFDLVWHFTPKETILKNFGLSEEVFCGLVQNTDPVLG